MALSLPLEQVLLPKDITDDFYNTWNGYYVELFPSPVKPKYRPMSKLITSDDEKLTRSMPDILESVGKSDDTVLSVALRPKIRVGDNIDEFITNYRKSIYRSSSTDQLMEHDANHKEIFSVDNADELYLTLGKGRSKSDISQQQNLARTPKKHRFSWCGTQTCKLLSNLPGRRKTYEFTTEENIKLQQSGHTLNNDKYVCHDDKECSKDDVLDDVFEQKNSDPE